MSKWDNVEDFHKFTWSILEYFASNKIMKMIWTKLFVSAPEKEKNSLCYRLAL